MIIPLPKPINLRIIQLLSGILLVIAWLKQTQLLTKNFSYTKDSVLIIFTILFAMILGISTIIDHHSPQLKDRLPQDLFSFFSILTMILIAYPRLFTPKILITHQAYVGLIFIGLALLTAYVPKNPIVGVRLSSIIQLNRKSKKRVNLLAARLTLVVGIGCLLTTPFGSTVFGLTLILTTFTTFIWVLIFASKLAK